MLSGVGQLAVRVVKVKPLTPEGRGDWYTKLAY